jgi:hypothetical protein
MNQEQILINHSSVSSTMMIKFLDDVFEKIDGIKKERSDAQRLLDEHLESIDRHNKYLESQRQEAIEKFSEEEKKTTRRKLDRIDTLRNKARLMAKSGKYVLDPSERATGPRRTRTVGIDKGFFD